MQQVPLYDSSGQVVAHARVDDVDYEAISERRWHCTQWGYARTSVGTGPKLYMHHLVYERAYGGRPEELINHKDRDRLNNQRSNLRPATQLQNALNRSLHSNNTSGFAGVREDKRTGRFQAFGNTSGRWASLGYFDSARDAAIAHDLYLLETYPVEFVRLNCPNATAEEVSGVRAALAEPKKRRGKSRFRGVLLHDYDGRAKQWHARIKVHGRNRGLGYYLTEEEAAAAYNRAAQEAFGQDAWLNVLPNAA